MADPIEIRPEVTKNPPGECCEKCRFGFVLGIHKEGLKKIMECRRLPPTAYPLAQGQTISLYPPTRGDLWCGEFAPAKSVIVS